MNQNKELYFDYGWEGGGESIYRITNENKIITYMAEGNSGGFLDEEEDPHRSWEKHYPDFENYWKKFTEYKRWYCLHPVFIHPDLFPFIILELDKLKSETDFNNYQKSKWEEVLDENKKE